MKGKEDVEEGENILVDSVNQKKAEEAFFTIFNP